MTDERVPWHWYADMKTDESKQAVQELLERRGFGVDPHDPEFLLCLDKVDVISRYQMLLSQREAAAKSTEEFHQSELKRLRKTVEHAGRWWDHCILLRQRKRKTVNLADMFPEGLES